jgi:endonuclease/exonuclease/phosphatase family metal-dependent hydrolase
MSFSIASFNLCHLQLPGQSIYGEFAWTPEQYQRKVGWTAEQLKRVYPIDVFCFQEVWSAHALAAVFRQAGLEEQYTLVCHPDEDSGMHVACAVHRNFTVHTCEWHTHFPTDILWKTDDVRYAMSMDIRHFSRPVLKLRLQDADGSLLTVFNTHLKSRRPTSAGNPDYYGVGADHWVDFGRVLSSARRLAEAAVIRLLVNRQLSQSNDAVIIGGDFNDRMPGSVLDILKGDCRYRKGNNNRSGRRADWGLYHLVELDNTQPARHTPTPVRDYITFYGDDELLALDHLLFSWQFHPRAAGCRQQLQEWTLISEHLGGSKPYASDHAMVVARFSGKARKSK